MTEVTSPLFDIETYIQNLKWSDQATDYEKTLVIGNLRGLFSILKADLAASAARERAANLRFAAYRRAWFHMRRIVQELENREWETKTYSDGTTATGIGPFPELSPAQQETQERASVDAAVDGFVLRNLK